MAYLMIKETDSPVMSQMDVNQPGIIISRVMIYQGGLLYQGVNNSDSVSLFARARRSIFPLMRRLSIIKAGEQHTVKTSHIVIISRPKSTHSLVKVLVPMVFISELTNAVLTGCRF